MNTNNDTNRNKNRQENYVPVITRRETAKVSTKEILYIETELRIVNIHTVGREYRFYGKLDDVIKFLDCNFHRCHKSCIVNLEKIVRMEDGVFYFSGGKTLRVGQNNYRHTRNHYIEFLKQNAFITFP